MRILCYPRIIGLLTLVTGLVSCHNGATALTVKQDSTNLKNSTDTIQPRLTINVRRFNAGYVKKGEIVEGHYIIKNTGPKKLEIEYVNPDCTCTGFSLSNKSIQSGDSSILILKMSTKDKEGETQIHATISANTPTRLYQVTLVADVF